MLSASLSPIEWYQTVNELHDRIARKAVELCIQGMVEEGFGQPPVPYAFIVFGSSGREEATLWSDQDNGMIISDTPQEGKEEYFAQARTANDGYVRRAWLRQVRRQSHVL